MIRMRIRKATSIRIGLLTVAVGALELACRFGLVRRFTMIPPSEMFMAMLALFETGGVGSDIRETLTAAAAFLLQLFNTGREPMICSEFVFRCYREALPGAVNLLARSPGSLRFGEREVPIGKSGGIHRGSALALLLEKHGSQLSAGSVNLAGPLQVARPLDVSAVGEAIEAYFEDLQKQAPKAARIDLTSPELLPSFERFAASLHRTRRRQEKNEMPRAALLGDLFDAAADFVTPGDLQRSKSLAFCGKLKTKE